MPADPARQPRGSERLLSGLQRQRHHRQHGDSRRAGRVGADAGLRSHRRRTTAAPTRTAEIADELARTYPHVRVVHHPQNRGYGGALQTGFRSATKELIFYTDGDAQYDPAELALLWASMTPDADLVNGYKISRVRSAAPHRHRPSLPPHRQHPVRPDACATSTAISG